MLKKLEITTICLVICLRLFGCGGSGEDLSTGPNAPPGSSGEWNIPENEIISGGVPKDGIPSLFNPEKISAEDGSYLIDDALVVGIVVAGQPMAYPHSVLDWHEIVNEDSNGSFTLSYCPLTGTAVAFDGTVLGKFGVSGLLYRNNLIMFDRRTDSRWPQLRLQSDQGPSKNTKIRVLPTIETSWGTWKKLFPGTLILSTNTGFNRPYGQPGFQFVAIVLSCKRFFGSTVLVMFFKTTVKIICNSYIEYGFCGVADNVEKVNFCVQDKV